MPLNESIVDSVAATNFKSVAEAPAFYSNLAMGDAVAHQRGINAIREAAIGGIIDKLIHADPAEAISSLKLLTGDAQGAQMNALLAALNSGQQGVKSAQSTPPVTP